LGGVEGEKLLWQSNVIEKVIERKVIVVDDDDDALTDDLF